VLLPSGKDEGTDSGGRESGLTEFSSGELLVRFLGILWFNLILSGDNVVVIALAVRRLEGPVHRKAMLLGIFGAVVLRLFFAAIVAYLLVVPLLLAVGGILLFWIAWQLTQGNAHEEGDKVKVGGNLREAVRIIIVADAVMSLDNVVALVGVSGGNLWLLTVGLALTIPLVVFGSAILSTLFGRFPWLIYVGAGALVWVAVEMFFEDPIVTGFVGGSPHGAGLIIQVLITVLFVVAAGLWSRTTRNTDFKRLDPYG
jgi:YjbE family integral membrane protein